MKKNLKKRNKKGFTLIELVVVIAILGILAAILVPVISGFIETANQSADNANARLIYQAGAMYFAANNDGTTTSADLQDYMGSTWPQVKSKLFAGDTVPGTFTFSVGADGVITVDTDTAGYNPGSGKLEVGYTPAS